MAVTRPDAEQRRWKLDPAEVAPELRENFLVRYLASLTPEQEAALDAALALDEAAVALDEAELDDADE